MIQILSDQINVNAVIYDRAVITCALLLKEDNVAGDSKWMLCAGVADVALTQLWRNYIFPSTWFLQESRSYSNR